MKHRGRKSAGEVAVLTQRPDPLPQLNKDEKEIWQRVVNGLPSDWFRPETLDLLREYCHQISLSLKIQKMIVKLPMDAPPADMERFVRLKEKTSRMIVTLATKMRLSQQSTYDREKVKSGGAPADDPWSSAV